MLAISIALAASAEARVYRWVDAKGTVTYSDQPPPKPAASERESRVDEILDLSGLRRQIFRVPTEIQERLKEQRGHAPRADLYDRLAEAFARAFTAEAIESRVRGAIVARFDPVHAEACLVWLRGPISRRLTDAEAEASSPAAQAQLAGYAVSVQKVAPPADRAAVARKLVEVSGLVDVWLDIMFGMAHAAARAVDTAQPPGKRLKPGQLEAKLRVARAKAYEPMRVNAVITTLFTYRTIPLTEMREYVDFLATPAGQWLLGTAGRGLVDAISGLTEHAMTEVAPTVAKTPTR